MLLIIIYKTKGKNELEISAAIPIDGKRRNSETGVSSKIGMPSPINGSQLTPVDRSTVPLTTLEVMIGWSLLWEGRMGCMALL